MHKTFKWVFIAVFCLFLLIPLTVNALDYRLIPGQPYPGAIFKVVLTGLESGSVPISATFLGKDMPVIKDGDSYWLLLGVGLDVKPGRHVLTIRVQKKGNEEDILTIPIAVAGKDYPREYLKVPEKMVEFPEDILKRVISDQKAIASSVKVVSDRRLFQGNFIKPVDGAIRSTFGLRRFFNNKPRSPHSGVDLACRKGTPVRATNSGQVVLVRDCYLSGKTVVIEHGLGLYSIYAHLDKVLVTRGQSIKKGEVIGLSGASGRATGPHLHWGVSLYGMRLDPISLLKIF